MALVKYNNNSISAITAAAAIPAGAMTLIKEQTASSSSTISFVHGTSDVVLDGTYPIYLFKFIGIHPATDNTHFTFNGSDDDSSHSYDVTKTTTMIDCYQSEGGAGATLSYGGGSLAQSTAFQRLTNDQGNANDENVSGYLYLFNPSSTVFVKHFLAGSSRTSHNDYAAQQYYGGYFNTTADITAIQFKFSSGNIDAGTIKLYGIKDS